MVYIHTLEHQKMEIFDVIYFGNLKEVKRIVTKNPNCVHVKNEQKLTFSGVGLHHQNGVAERAIGTL